MFKYLLILFIVFSQHFAFASNKNFSCSDFIDPFVNTNWEGKCLVPFTPTDSTRFWFREEVLTLKKLAEKKIYDPKKDGILGDPIRIVVYIDALKRENYYIMQGNHRIYSALQEENEVTVRALMYTPEEWEELTELPFNPNRGVPWPEVPFGF